jgi:hypothetical protein
MSLLGIIASSKFVAVAPTSPVSGYYMWFDASDATTITSSGGFVSQWDDKSGNGFNVSQAGGNTTKPETGVNTMNGKNVLKWNETGAVRGLSRVNPAGLQGDPNLTIFVVANYKTGGIGTFAYNISLGFGDDQASPDGIVGYNAVFTYSNGYLYGIGANGRIVNGFTDLRDTARCYVLKKSGPTTTAYFNKTSQGTASGAYALSSFGFAIGYLPQNSTVGNYAFNGDIAEVLIYTSALSDTDRELNNDYLTAKWGL